MNPPLSDFDNVYCVYMIQCKDRSIYVGMTNNVARRLRQHNREIAGGPASTAPATKRPVRLVYLDVCTSKSDALSREFNMKAKNRACRIMQIKHSGRPFTNEFDPGPLIKKSDALKS